MVADRIQVIQMQARVKLLGGMQSNCWGGYIPQITWVSAPLLTRGSPADHHLWHLHKTSAQDCPNF